MFENSVMQCQYYQLKGEKGKATQGGQGVMMTMMMMLLVVFLVVC